MPTGSQPPQLETIAQPTTAAPRASPKTTLEPAAVEAKAAANKARVDALPEDTSWGYAHGGTD